ncbi:MAG: DUF3592 domain-containing protein [Planctomycetaceae bacterium]|nr:DUF3592 domain-containing protein [Planctomycetaceae bacterium]
MGIPLVRDHTETVAGVAIRSVTCEHCCEQFVYVLSREVSETAVGLLTVEPNAREAARATARENLDQQLSEGVDPVPCPRCGRYQAAMVEEIRQWKYTWMFLVGLLGFIAPFGVFVYLIGIRFQFASLSTTAWTVIAVATIVGPLFGGMMWWLRGWRARQFDPNSDDLRNPWAIAEARAMTREEFERDGPRRLLEPIVEERASRAASDLSFTHFIAVATGLAFAGIGIWGFTETGADLWQGFRSKNWPTAPAELKLAEVDTETFRKKEQWVTRETLRIEYTYTVQGQQYTGSRYRFGKTSSTNVGEIRTLAGELKRSPQFDIRYAPGNPKVSVVVPGLTSHQSMVTLLLLGCLVGGVGLCGVSQWHYSRLRRKQPSPAFENAV